MNDEKEYGTLDIIIGLIILIILIFCVLAGFGVF